LPVVLSVNRDQYKEYSAIFDPVQLIKDNEMLQIKGPLCGVLSVHEQHPTKDLFVLACDMPLMELSILKKLYTYYKNDPGFQAYVFTNDREPEPLCAIYKSEGLSSILQIHQKGNLVKHSMKFMLELLHCFLIPIQDEQKKFFSNLNAHSALNGL